MDKNIVKAILRSCESVSKDLEESPDYQNLLKNETFLPTSDTIFNALCKSLTQLLCYKVSKAAYQRYSVRIHVITILREWCRISDTYEHESTFTNHKQASKLIQNILDKYLTDSLLDNCDSSDNLLPLVSSLMCLSSTNPSYTSHLNRLLVRLTEFESTEESQNLLCIAIVNSSKLNLELSSIEQIYTSQKSQLIEQPLLDDFEIYAKINKTNDVDNNKFKSTDLLEELFQFICKSPRIFQIVCMFLKELLVRLDYATVVMNFIQTVLRRITRNSESQDKKILDLYPRKLQSTIILLEIEPSYHSRESKDSTLRLLDDIYCENKSVGIILLSHYPLWLKEYRDYFVKMSYSIE